MPFLFHALLRIEQSKADDWSVGVAQQNCDLIFLRM